MTTVVRLYRIALACGAALAIGCGAVSVPTSVKRAPALALDKERPVKLRVAVDCHDIVSAPSKRSSLKFDAALRRNRSAKDLTYEKRRSEKSCKRTKWAKSAARDITSEVATALESAGYRVVGKGRRAKTVYVDVRLYRIRGVDTEHDTVFLSGGPTCPPGCQGLPCLHVNELGYVTARVGLSTSKRKKGGVIVDPVELEARGVALRLVESLPPELARRGVRPQVTYATAHLVGTCSLEASRQRVIDERRYDWQRGALEIPKELRSKLPTTFQPYQEQVDVHLYETVDGSTTDAISAAQAGDWPRAHALFEQEAKHLEPSDDERSREQHAMKLHNLAASEMAVGQLSKAKKSIVQALRVYNLFYSHALADEIFRRADDAARLERL